MLAAMTPMLDVAELEVWCRKPIAGTPKEPFAIAVLQAASLVVADKANHADWLADDFPGPLPGRAKLICTLLAKRSFLNPDSVISEGGIGPIGGDRYVEEMAKFLTLTDQEIADLEDLDDGSGAGGTGGLWTMEITSGRGPWLGDTIHLPDLDPLADQWPVLSTRDFPEMEPGLTPYGP